jgi:UDP-N-acetylglucosamine 2-epimerase
MKKLKVVTVVGTRPEIIRLSEVIKTLELFCDHSLVHTGQNFDFELNEIFFKDLSINKPDYFLNAAGKSAAATIGNVISKSDEVFSKIKPDWPFEEKPRGSSSRGRKVEKVALNISIGKAWRYRLKLLYHK